MKKEKVIITCSHCAKEFESYIYPILHVEEDKRLYKKALDTTLFLQKCPYCNLDTVFPYTCLFIDEIRKIAIGLGLDEKTYVTNVLKEIKDTEGYLLRIVDQPIELSEKLEINQAKMKDTLMECMKYHLLENLHKQGIDAVHLIYHQERMIVIDSKGQTGSFQFEQAWYQEAVRSYKELCSSSSKNVYKIDDAWVRSILHPLKIEESSEGVSIE